MNKACSNIGAHAVDTMETSSAFLRSQGGISLILTFNLKNLKLIMSLNITKYTYYINTNLILGIIIIVLEKVQLQ